MDEYTIDHAAATPELRAVAALLAEDHRTIVSLRDGITHREKEIARLTEEARRAARPAPEAERPRWWRTSPINLCTGGHRAGHASPPVLLPFGLSIHLETSHLLKAGSMPSVVTVEAMATGSDVYRINARWRVTTSAAVQRVLLLTALVDTSRADPLSRTATVLDSEANRYNARKDRWRTGPVRVGLVLSRVSVAQSSLDWG